MSAALEEVLAAMNRLSPDELLVVQERLQNQLRPNAGSKNGAGRRLNIPGSYIYTLQEIEAHLAEVFTPQQRLEMEKADISNLPVFSKTSTQILEEGREDRF